MPEPEHEHEHEHDAFRLPTDLADEVSPRAPYPTLPYPTLPHSSSSLSPSPSLSPPSLLPRLASPRASAHHAPHTQEKTARLARALSAAAHDPRPAHTLAQIRTALAARGDSDLRAFLVRGRLLSLSRPPLPSPSVFLLSHFRVLTMALVRAPTGPARRPPGCPGIGAGRRGGRVGGAWGRCVCEGGGYGCAGDRGAAGSRGR